MTNEENTILFNGLIKKLNMKDAKETREFLEKIATVFLNSVNSDDERPDLIGREMVEALASNDLNRFCIAVCGWEPSSLLNFYIDEEEQKNIISQVNNLKKMTDDSRLVDLTAAFEVVYNVPDEERTVYWFGDYAMWVIRSGCDEKFRQSSYKALEAFCTTLTEFRQLPEKELVFSAITERFRKLKTVIPKYRFSLVQYEKEEDGFVYGTWIQDCTGTFDEACRRAAETEAANSNRIKVAVVEAFGTPCPVYEELKLKKLN